MPVTRKVVYLASRQLSVDERRAFDILYTEALADPGPGVPRIGYGCALPKHVFLNYLVDTHGLLVHGSNDPNIELLEVRADSDNVGRVIHAVWAASDGLWPVFFAIVHRKPYAYSLDNSCRRESDEAGGWRKAYHFSTSTLHDEPWTDGMLYIVPRETFKPVLDREGRPGEQWTSTSTVRPLAKLSVSPSDFIFLPDVQGHTHGT